MEEKVFKRVTGALIRKDGKILIAQRAADDECPLMWEFPGGKIEEGETPEECIVREIREELNLTIRPVGVFMRIVYHLQEKRIPITFFNAEILGGEMRLNVHEDVRWIDIGEIPAYAFMPPDAEAVKKLLKEKPESGGKERF
jgi:8-oxo-dGTP diphosphatase